MRQKCFSYDLFTICVHSATRHNIHIVIDTDDFCIQISWSSVFPKAYMAALVSAVAAFSFSSGDSGKLHTG